MVMAQSLFKVLKRRSPDCLLNVIGPRWAMPLLARMSEVEHATCADIAHGELGLGKRWRIGRQLRQEHYDQVFLMSRSLKSALIPWFARVPLRTGYLGESRYGIVNDIRKLDATILPKKVQQYVALGLAQDEAARVATEFEYPELSVNRAHRDTLIDQYGLSSDRPVVALAPGAAYGPIKRWPPGHFALLVKALVEHGYDCWIFGGDDDKAIGDSIASAAPAHCINFCGKTDLSDVVDLMSLASTYVGNDTGLMHIASAVIPHVVVLYGPTSPIYTPPLQTDAICLWLNRGDTLKTAEVGPGGHARSLSNLPVDDVVRACIAPDDSIPSRYDLLGNV